jgi:plasmid stability protein
MASITLKSVPSSVHRALKSRAKLHKRSLTQEMIAVLEESVSSPKNIDVDAMIEEARKFRGSLKFTALPKDISRFKRQGRP